MPSQGKCSQAMRRKKEGGTILYHLEACIAMFNQAGFLPTYHSHGEIDREWIGRGCAG